MIFGNSNRFGTCWLFFGYTLALHVMDEAAHDFLSVYNPNALLVRRSLPYLALPTFTIPGFLASLLVVLTLWLALAPVAFRHAGWLRWVAIPISILAGIINGLAHLAASIYFGRFMPGVYSAPLILLSGTLLLRVARATAVPGHSATAGA